MLRSCLVLFIILPVLELSAQAHPKFGTFKGEVYEIPAKHVMNAKFKYNEKIHEYEVIADIEWDSVNIPSTTTDHAFPDVSRLDRFGMVLESEMTIQNDGCYQFILNSDDGSVFWIGEREIVNNDGTHPMRIRKDTGQLLKGKYPIKLWYYQGFKHKYGFEFNGFYVSENCPLGKEELDPGSVGGKQNQKLSLQSPILFDYDSFVLKTEAHGILDSMLNEFDQKDFKEIAIYGFTCDKGDNEYNLVLSQKRADALKDYLLSTKNWPGLIFRSIGMGELNPIVANATEDDRRLNRRVEIVFK